MDAPGHRRDRSIRSRVEEALVRACRASAPGRVPAVILEKPRREGHGDLSTNLALLVARETGEKGRDVAERLAAALRADAGLCPSVIAKIQIAGGGFINFFLAPGAFHAALALLLSDPERFGVSVPSDPKRILVEFVSANPTGPLTVAHGRQAAVGDSIARLLGAAGHQVVREYYLNDRGKQIRLLGLSAWRRYLELFGDKAEIPEDGYRGDYLRLVAARAREREGDRWRGAAEEAAVA
ncbi:MAG TPA: arginine--tRNA ligase, partial [bacterium]|nr:arginine--tRNA ligase [bacterium]